MIHVADFKKLEIPTAWYWNPENNRLEEGVKFSFRNFAMLEETHVADHLTHSSKRFIKHHCKYPENKLHFKWQFAKVVSVISGGR